MRLYNLLKEICRKVGLIDDYILAQGTSGIWTYRKWNSGMAECWSNPTSNTTYSLTSTSQYGFYCNSEISIPAVVSFISAPAITASACGGTGLTTVNISSINKTEIGFRPYCTTSLSWSGKIFFSCKGRWK